MGKHPYAITNVLPASFWARRIFCRLFHQIIKQPRISKNETKTPIAMPTLEPVERWGPHVGNPGMPQRPALAVKLHIAKNRSSQFKLLNIIHPF